MRKLPCNGLVEEIETWGKGKPPIWKDILTLKGEKRGQRVDLRCVVEERRWIGSLISNT